MFRKNSVKVIISIAVISVLIGLVLLVTIPSANNLHLSMCKIIVLI